MAGRWSRPLQALQRASREIACGQRSARLQPAGALEIAALIEDVNTMTGERARLEKARRFWIAQISHELRTPLAVLRGEIESIEDGARQLTRLVNDLHTLSMAGLGRLPCAFAAGDASAALLRMARHFEARAAQRGLRLALTAAPPGGFSFDEAGQRACWQGQALPLTQVEFRLFRLLLSRPGHVFGRARLLEALHDDFRDVSDRAIDSHIKNLRRKIEPFERQGGGIASVYGLGYRFDQATER